MKNFTKIIWASLFRWSTILLFSASFLMILPGNADAVSQWARKYKVPCSMCHTSFPRLNYFGEQFMRNGFQWPGGAADGNTEGKEVLSDDFSIDKVGHWLGARLSLTPFMYKTNDKVNSNLEDSFNIGRAKWLQFFVAGTISENVSIFIEQEFESDGAKFSWFHLFFTNLSGTYVNFQVGRLSPVDFTPFPDRLRIWEKSNILNIKSSGGKGVNSTNIRSSRPGIQYYGYRGPLLWFAGVDNGKDSSDTDRGKNIWGGIRLEITEAMNSPFEGSSVGLHVYSGTDSKDETPTDTSPVIARVDNDFMRYTVAANIRHGDKVDVQMTYQRGEDDNYTLAATPVKADFQGYTVTCAYWKEVWYYVLQYDQIDSTDIPGIEMKKVSPSIWYFLRSNIKAGLAARIDVSSGSAKKHEAALQLRAMF